MKIREVKGWRSKILVGYFTVLAAKDFVSSFLSTELDNQNTIDIDDSEIAKKLQKKGYTDVKKINISTELDVDDPISKAKKYALYTAKDSAGNEVDIKVDVAETEGLGKLNYTETRRVEAMDRKGLAMILK